MSLHEMRAADILRDYGRDIIEFGPGRHAASGTFYLYLCEPGATASNCIRARRLSLPLIGNRFAGELQRTR